MVNSPQLFVNCILGILVAWGRPMSISNSDIGLIEIKRKSSSKPEKEEEIVLNCKNRYFQQKI